MSFPSTRVYPRVCGGTRPGPSEPTLLTGLSPRVRGNRIPTFASCVVSGSIPACAGEPATPRHPDESITVYPRVCGGTQLGAYLVLVEDGLSPRVRGNLIQAGLDAASKTVYPRVCGGNLESCKANSPARWSIPACAGEPMVGGSRPRSRQVYPRVCGGTRLPADAVLPGAGLSPRVRGNRGNPHFCHKLFRSIPACAGEPSRDYLLLSPPPVYPRVCGGT